MTIVSGLEIPIEALDRLCRRYQVKEMSIFGSVARGETRPESDIDILVEFLPGHTIDLFDFGHLESELSGLFGRRVDLVSKHGMNPRMAPHILRDAQPIYAA
ncbi:MAG: nucleotidyltransferase family protein [Bryobacteraceae bacterium]